MKEINFSANTCVQNVFNSSEKANFHGDDQTYSVAKIVGENTFKIKFKLSVFVLNTFCEKLLY